MFDLNSNLLVWFIRIFLGVLISAAGFGKLLDITGFTTIIENYRLGLPKRLLRPTAIIVSTFELAVGLAILTGFHLRGAAALSIVMHSGYFVLLTFSLLRGLELKNCGCFGVFFARPLRWYSPIEDLVLIYLSFGLYMLAN